MSTQHGDRTSLTLLARIQSGESLAWDRLTRLYAPLVRYWCRRWGVDDADLDDLTQEIWLAVGPTLGGYRPGPERSFRGWMRGVTRHKTQDWHRRRANQLTEAVGGTVAIQILEQVKADLDIDDAADAGEKTESQALYSRALKEVKGEFEDRTWKAFLGVTLDGKPAAEVGAELGLSPSAVRMAKSRVLHRLRQELGELID